MDATEIRLLTELAARAADYTMFSWHNNQCTVHDGEKLINWNPAHDDGDSFDLMCDLEIDIQFRVVGGMRVIATGPGVDAVTVSCEHMTFRTAARLAILQAAAAVGERIQKR